MPRENRKRGKKHSKKSQDNVVGRPEEHPEHEEEPEAGPSWIVSAPDPSQVDREAPFGYVDAEVKAYFRTVDLQIRDWQDEGHGTVGGEEDVDPNEDRRLFFVAALTEMSEKEKQLATDPDCSAILERMSYSMDDFVRRVFVDRLSGSFEQLLKHRFASHVCQTLLTVASDTVSREARGIFPPPPESSDAGELRTMTQLVVDLCEVRTRHYMLYPLNRVHTTQELLPTFSTLIMDPFASHVIRALLVLLAPDCLAEGDGPSGPSVRSKKSAAYKARQGPMKSVFADDSAQAHANAAKRVPPAFPDAASAFVTALRTQLGESEVRALAANQVASPVLQMLLEVETGYGLADAPDSLMDRALVGLITLSHEDPSAAPEASDYLATLLRDPTASHLLETLVRRAPDAVFGMLWTTYFRGRLAKLAAHPVANFVVAKALERVHAEQLGEACAELDAAWTKIIKTSRTGVLRALVDRCAALRTHEGQIVEAIHRAFELVSPEDKLLLVPCIIRLKSLAVSTMVHAQTLRATLMPGQDYQTAMSVQAEQPDHPALEPLRRRARTEVEADPLEPKTQGAVLLQSMLHLSAPHNEPVLNSIQALTADELLAMAHHVTSSRVLDAVLDLPAVPAKAKRTLVLAFLGHFHALVDDRIGSRVGDRCWAYADPYLKEKIARSLLPHEQFLAGSFYGKFFARRLSLHLLQRNPEEWKTVQSTAKAPAPVPPAATSASRTPAPGAEQPKKKRKARPQDEIDALFDAAPGKKFKKGGTALGDEVVVPEQSQGKTKPSFAIPPDDLLDVMGAIRAAPRDEKKHHKKKRTH
ncbi:ARM repeat-containing protein [Amylocystis lapponica]|nr:ARM repeat-containing protein [Amylocystis lapponica]